MSRRAATTDTIGRKSNPRAGKAFRGHARRALRIAAAVQFRIEIAPGGCLGAAGLVQRGKRRATAIWFVCLFVCLVKVALAATATATVIAIAATAGLADSRRCQRRCGCRDLIGAGVCGSGRRGGGAASPEDDGRSAGTRDPLTGRPAQCVINRGCEDDSGGRIRRGRAASERTDSDAARPMPSTKPRSPTAGPVTPFDRGPIV